MKTRYKIPIIAACVFASWILFPNASAVCCFPYNMNHYVDPITGDLVLNGELLNDSYRREPFGNTEYRFVFLDKDNNQILERNILLTDRLPVEGGAVIPFIVTFPFQVVLEDVDEKTIQQISNFHMEGTETLDYFPLKPADLAVSSNHPIKIDTISGKNGDVFNKWQISGNITNTHSQKTKNVYVVASLRNKNDNIIGVAGYSANSIQPVTLDGLETKNFVISALVPVSEMPTSVIVYAESDESSIVHQYYKPIIMRDATDRGGKISTDPKKPILISANITNISRNDLDFEWIIQIKKSPKSISEGDISEYPESKVAFIKTIPTSIDAQKSTILEYQWFPQSNGIYFYNMYVWDESGAKALSNPFMRSFLDDNWLIVSSNLNSVTNQIKSGIPLDEIQCRQGLQLTHKTTNGNIVCVKPETKQKLTERGWAKPVTIENASGSKNTEKDTVAKLLTENKIEYLPDKLVVTGGPAIRGDPRCGAAIDLNATTHWFIIDSISNPQKMTLFSENPNPCQVNTDSCFCDVQMEVAALTLASLSYFSPEEEKKFANVLIDYLVKENINRTPKFLIGKFNLNYTEPAAIGYCGELWGYNTIDYFDGAIVNDQIKDYGLERELSPLCAISEDAKWWERK